MTRPTPHLERRNYATGKCLRGIPGADGGADVVTDETATATKLVRIGANRTN